MSEITKEAERNISTIAMLGLTIITVGTYQFMWLTEKVPFFRERLGVSVSSTNIVIYAALAAIGSFFVQVAGMIDPPLGAYLSIIGVGLSASGMVYLYVSVTKVVLKALSTVLLVEERADLRVNEFLAFIFGQFYICYKINEVSDVVKRAQILNNTDPK